ncbi:SAM-dependent methyltransferase [Streptomyces sp. NPDC058195]|uniref:SAM-dependent methyltransferase n=1 Tax=Streptomyces sp. NPDC058195 TaxID=3346375 RepID=UPI0036EDEB35
MTTLMSAMDRAVTGIAPSTARIIHWLLDGEGLYHPVDRGLGAGVLEVAPWAGNSLEAARTYAHATIRVLRALGYRQFVDLGSGLPTPSRRFPHTVASAASLGLDFKVLHIDADPYVIKHGPGLLPDVFQSHGFRRADLRDTGQIRHALTASDLDLEQPTAFLLHSVLDQFLSAAAREIVSSVLALAPPGSVLSLTHATADLCPDGSAEAAARLYTKAGLPNRPRTAAEVRDLLKQPDHSSWLIRNPGIACAADYPSPDQAHAYAVILQHADALC